MIYELERELDEPKLLDLLDRAVKLRPKVERDGLGLTELEFVLTSLLQLGHVDESKVKPLIVQFRKFDVTATGRVGLADLSMTKNRRKESIQAIRASNSLKLNAGLESRKLSTLSAMGSIQKRMMNPAAQPRMDHGEFVTV